MLSFRTQSIGTKQRRKPPSFRIRPQTLDAAYSSVGEVLHSLGTTEQGLSDQEALDRFLKRGSKKATIKLSVPFIWKFFTNSTNSFLPLRFALPLLSLFLLIEHI